MQETQVQSLGWEAPLEKEMATQSSILAWKIPWTEEHGGLQSMGSNIVGHNLTTKQQQSFFFLILQVGGIYKSELLNRTIFIAFLNYYLCYLKV